MKIYLEADSYSTVTYEADTDDKWDRDSTERTWSFGKISASSGFDYIETDRDFQIGQKLFLIVAVWSSGDSFGYDGGEYMEIFAVYDDVNLAVEAEKLLSETTIPLILPEGFEVRYLPWRGYFEKLDYVQIVEGTLYP
jgi:hypothetical protein